MRSIEGGLVKNIIMPLFAWLMCLIINRKEQKTHKKWLNFISLSCFCSLNPNATTVDAIYKVHYKKESLFLVNSEIPINPFY